MASEQINKNNKKIKRKKKRLWIIFLLFLLICLVYYLSTAQRFDLNDIIIKGNYRLESQLVAKLSGIKYKDNLFLLSKRKIKNNLKPNPYIQDIVVKKTYPNVLYIIINEKKIIGYIQNSGKYLLIEDNGKVVDEVKIGNIKKDDPKILTLKLTISNNKALSNDQINFIKNINNSQLNNKISSYSFLDQGKERIVTNDGIKIQFDNRLSFDYQIEIISNIFKDAKNEDKNLKSISFSEKEDPIVEFIIKD